MNYEQIDPIFYAWAQRHGLQVYTIYKDEEVRVTRLYGKGKEYADVSIDLFPLKGFFRFRGVGNGRVWVSVGIARRPLRNSQSEQLEANLETLDEVLEKAYEKATAWLRGEP